LREHASQREKLAITIDYYIIVTGELDKALHASEEFADIYPRDDLGYEFLDWIYSMQGQYEKAMDLVRQALRLSPDHVVHHADLVNILLSTQRFDEARQQILAAHSRYLDSFVLHAATYALAFLGRDSASMAKEQQWLATNSALENQGLLLESDTEAYYGHLIKARKLTNQYVDSAIRADTKEAAAIGWENAALRDSAFGYFALAREEALAG
jgi:tetratricopeptide (TPR) repeat protein